MATPSSPPPTLKEEDEEERKRERERDYRAKFSFDLMGTNPQTHTDNTNTQPSMPAQTGAIPKRMSDRNENVPTRNENVPTNNDNINANSSIGLNALILKRYQIDLFCGNKNGQPTGVSLPIWLQQLENVFQEERIVNDSMRKVYAKNNCSTDEACDIRFALEMEVIRKAVTWKDFKNALHCVYGTIEVNVFKQFQKILGKKWNNQNTIVDVSGSLTLEFREFARILSSKYNIEIAPEVINVLILCFIHNMVNDESRIAMFKHLMHSHAFEDVSHQLQQYREKIAGGLVPRNAKESFGRHNNKGNVNQIVVNETEDIVCAKVGNMKIEKKRVGKVQSQTNNNKVMKACTNCERIGHDTIECKGGPYCTFCRHAHKRGTTPQCANTTWTPQHKNKFKSNGRGGNRNNGNGYQNKNFAQPFVGHRFVNPQNFPFYTSPQAQFRPQTPFRAQFRSRFPYQGTYSQGNRSVTPQGHSNAVSYEDMGRFDVSNEPPEMMSGLTGNQNNSFNPYIGEPEIGFEDPTNFYQGI